MSIYLAVTPDLAREAAAWTGRLAHVAYGVNRAGHLAWRGVLMGTRGGLMVLGDRDWGTVRDPAALCREICRECAGREYAGVAADFEGPVTKDRAVFLDALSQALGRWGRRLLVPEDYAGAVRQGTVLICTAISGGSLPDRLEEAARRYGRERLALDLQRLRMRFPLPCPGGEGESLDGETLEALLGERGPCVFYSADLCAKYFTYAQGGRHWFVLFDDADTLLRKVRLGREKGIGLGLLMYPEVKDLLPRLFPGPSARGGAPSRSR